MLRSILANTYSIARVRWRSLLAVAMATWLVAGVLLFFAVTASLGTESGEPSPGVVVAAALLMSLVACWWLLAGVRVPLQKEGALDALSGARGNTPKLLVGSIVLAVLVLPVLLVVPGIVLVGALASGRPGWGIRAALGHGVLQLLRNLGVYVALLLVSVAVFALAAGFALLGGIAAAGVPAAAALESIDALREWASDAAVGIAIGSVVGLTAYAVVTPAFIAATWLAFDQRAAASEWDGEDLSAQLVEAELSPAVAALLGTSSVSPPGAPRRRRLRVPPRAATPGRLPSPGVHSVTDVTLPPGATTRPVDSPTLELDVFDVAPASAPGVAVAPSTQAMWVSSQPVPNAAAAFRQLAAGFEESGLWPVLLPATELAVHQPWHERRARRERDSIDATPQELLRARLDGSLRDSPLASTEAIAASGVSRGELGRGSGKRIDALDQAFELVGPAHLALVGVRRPGEVLHRIAWPGTAAADITGVELAELVASWEERYGALLVGVGASQLTFAVLRPPATLQEAIEAAAEHHATCPDECEAWRDDRSYAEALVDAPTWQLSWT